MEPILLMNIIGQMTKKTLRMAIAMGMILGSQNDIRGGGQRIVLQLASHRTTKKTGNEKKKWDHRLKPLNHLLPP